ALRSRVFVRDLHAFIKTHGLQGKIPNQHVIVFDEAQRAWDAAFMEYKRRVARSEPELLIEAGVRVPDWSLLVGLVGEGQEIFSGEEAGIRQWRGAVAASDAKWTIYCPPRLASEFEGLEVHMHDELDLTVSLRSHRAEELHTWVALLLQGSVALAARQAMRIQGAETYPMYVTRDFDEAKEYVRARYDGEEDKRYGVLVSSHAKNLQRMGIKSGYLDQRKMKVARWFNAPPDDVLSGCSFDMPVTEFQCQGLEVDMPIVGWGSDYRWDGASWNLRPIRRQYAQEDPVQLLQNAYRVLLTRGRDGLVVWVPQGEEMNLTEHVLLAAGLRPLPEADDVTVGAPPIVGGSSVLGAG
ncbi:MAG: DNA/RNA helicase domain-containing protein, partial [bacterium]